MMARRDVLDLSHWQTVIDWSAIKAEGVVAVILKASEGTSYRDDKYNAFRAAALDVGLEVASYHFLKHSNVVNQMEWYLASAQPDPGERVCIDYEDPACALDDLHEALDAIESLRPDLQLTVYGGHLLKDQLKGMCDGDLAPPRTSLWIAQYTTGEVSWPSGTWPYWSLWQYSDGKAGASPKNCPGVSGAVDTNMFNGTKDNCFRWFGPPAISAPSAISLTVPAGTVITINGKDFTAP